MTFCDAEYTDASGTATGSSFTCPDYRRTAFLGQLFERNQILTTSVVMMRRSAFDAAGGFDETLVAGIFCRHHDVAFRPLLVVQKPFPARGMFERSDPVEPIANFLKVHLAEMDFAAESHVAANQTFADGERIVMIDNPHADDMQMGWLPDLKMGLVTDIWNPGPPVTASSISLVGSEGQLVSRNPCARNQWSAAVPATPGAILAAASSAEVASSSRITW